MTSRGHQVRQTDRQRGGGHFQRNISPKWGHSFIIHSIHSAVCLTTGPYPLTKPVLHTVRSSASSFNFQWPFFSLRSSSDCLHLLPRLPATSILPSTFPYTTYFSRQFLCKMWPTQLAFLLFNVCQIFLLSLTQFPHDRSNWSSPSFSSTTFWNVPGISDLLSEMYNF